MRILGYLFVTNVAMLLMTMASCAGQDKTSGINCLSRVRFSR